MYKIRGDNQLVFSEGVVPFLYGIPYLRDTANGVGVTNMSPSSGVDDFINNLYQWREVCLGMVAELGRGKDSPVPGIGFPPLSPLHKLGDTHSSATPSPLPIAVWPSSHTCFLVRPSPVEVVMPVTHRRPSSRCSRNCLAMSLALSSSSICPGIIT